MNIQHKIVCPQCGEERYTQLFDVPAQAGIAALTFDDQKVHVPHVMRVKCPNQHQYNRDVALGQYAGCFARLR